MNMYVAMMAAVLILAWYMEGYHPGNKTYIRISCILMFALCALRDVQSIGIDSASSYIRIFHETGALEWSDLAQHSDGGSNVGFYMILKLLHTLTGGDYQLFYAVYTALIMGVFCWFIEKYSVQPVQSFAYFWGLLCYIFLFDGIKQGMAMALVTVAFDAIVERRPLRYAALMVLAWWVHVPALVFAPAWFIARMRPGRSYLIFLAALLAAVYRFRSEILELMLSVYGTEMQMNDMGFLGNKALIMLVIVAAALVLRPPEEEDRVYNILLQFMGISIVIQTFASYNNTFERLANYYFQFCVVFIPMVFQLDERRSHLLDPKSEIMVKQLAPWAFGGFGVWRFARYIASNAWAWLPYRFFFES